METSPTARQIAIIGAGIGGLTAALALAHAGHKVEIFERAASLHEAGAGVQLSPNASRVLHHLGLEEALRPHVFVPQATEFRHYKSGAMLATAPLGAAVEAAYGAPYYHIHRGDLQRVLLDAVDATNAVMHSGCAVTGVASDDDGVTLRADDTAHRADTVIGADGIHSATREALWGADAPRFTGNVAWRFLVPTESLPENMIAPTATAWWGPGKHVVHYYVRGGGLVNCVCLVEQNDWTHEGWTQRGDKQELQQHFTDWHDIIGTLLDKADPENFYKWALYDRAPMPQWGNGRVSLLGDAAHPMLPYVAQGAAQAIEDAAVLTRCLNEGADSAAALAAYEQLRRPRTARIQAASRRNARVFHLSGVAAWMRNRLVGRASRGVMHEIFSYDALDGLDA